MANVRTIRWMLCFGLLLGVMLAPGRAGANSASEAQAHYRHGQSFLQLGNSQAALRSLETAARLYRDAGDTLGEHNSLIDLSFAHYRLGNYTRAQTTLNQADGLAIPPHQAVAQRHRGWLMQALIWLEQGNITRSWQHLRQVQPGLLPDVAARNRRDLALGEIYRHTGQYSRALATLQRTLSQGGGDRVNRARALGEMGHTYYTLGDYDQAETAYGDALATAKSIGYWQGVPRYLNGLGHVYVQRQTYDQAQQTYLDAKDMAISLAQWHELASILNSLGQLYAEQGQPERALDTFVEALSYRDKYVGPDYSRTLSHLGQLHVQRQDYATALDYYTDAYAWARNNADEIGQITAMGGLAEIENSRGDRSKAEQTLYEALDKFEALEPGLQDVEKVSLFETQSYLYDQLQQVLISQGKVERALEVAERGRARAFAELLADQSAKARAPATIDNLTIDQMQSLAQQQGATLVQYSIIRQPSLGRSRFDDEALYIWVIQPDGTVNFEQLDLTQQSVDLKALLQASQASLGVRGFNAWGSGIPVAQSVDRESTLQQLHRLLIDPIDHYLPAAPEAKVMVVPHRELFLVPFPALKSADGQYLIEDHTLVTAPSLQTLTVLQQRSQRRSGEALVVGIDRQAIIVGNPEMPSVPFRPGGPPMPLTPLPGAEAEAVAIAPLLNAQPLLGQAATESTVRDRLADADIIHLATHGLLDERQGLSSAIALTPVSDNDPANDGLLTAQEVMQLRLRADLVVLSACNTGRGRITGDGVVGLSRSFLAAGANNLVASLWAVPDEATALLMTEFYQQLQTEPDKAIALRRAMLATLAEHPEPRDWAAFFLIGL